MECMFKAPRGFRSRWCLIRSWLVAFGLAQEHLASGLGTVGVHISKETVRNIIVLREGNLRLELLIKWLPFGAGST